MKAPRNSRPSAARPNGLAARFGKACFAALLPLGLAVGAQARAWAQEIDVDLELVLAVDISYSMDQEELQLQRNGYVAAFRHPDVRHAIRTGRFRRIAVTYIEWAGADLQFVVVPWRLIESEATAEDFAVRLERQPLQNASRTSVSGALGFAAGLFDGNGFAGLRRVIDISGDGPNNSGSPVEPARDAVVSMGIVINGLPLMLRPSYLSGFADGVELNDYYRDCVIGGAGAFLVTIDKLSEMTLAIRRKLILEMAGPVPRAISATHVPGHPKVDCLIGEKLRFDDP